MKYSRLDGGVVSGAAGLIEEPLNVPKVDFLQHLPRTTAF
jgi:hypothetical protein